MSSSQLFLHCECTPVHEMCFETEGETTPSEAVVDALSAAAGVDPMELPPLHDAVDVDALERLFARDDPSTVLGFTLDRWNVFVGGDGRVLVCNADDLADATPVFGRVDA